ncbi:NADH-quinone oxidoreductase subunit NuoK [Planctomicrobium piriforme]|uniref:NADH-quinone oxidoreductase subunit K n=1 Tax=Planctomicrobium piriforme TaxID=1576369 RepID=A0A1I3QQQ7_9PLAN|nr:NADH-quinone oxidoreductase subunit NuoK [Planctomicrobium piriforme]SFJ36418.1 NADH-quinone oxidoreductase subunit K [Planctomicrobium piriforme]
MTGEFERYLAVGAGLFVLGAIGFLTRRNMIILMLSAEMMIHGVSLTLVTFGQMHNTIEGQSLTIFGLTVAACEAGLALSLILALYQKSQSLDIDLWTDLREPDLGNPVTPEEMTTVSEPAHQQFPKLTPAGRPPVVTRRPLAAPTRATGAVPPGAAPKSKA